MRYRLFGPTGLRVSELFLGAMTFGEQGGVGTPRAGAFGVIRVPAAYLGLSPMSLALATRRATRPPAA
jgi:aryl-alcohol dehydrogenase-like predicted oxidoreductase